MTNINVIKSGTGESCKRYSGQSCFFTRCLLPWILKKKLTLLYFHSDLWIFFIYQYNHHPMSRSGIMFDVVFCHRSGSQTITQHVLMGWLSAVSTPPSQCCLFFSFAQPFLQITFFGCSYAFLCAQNGLCKNDKADSTVNQSCWHCTLLNTKITLCFVEWIKL